MCAFLHEVIKGKPNSNTTALQNPLPSFHVTSLVSARHLCPPPEEHKRVAIESEQSDLDSKTSKLIWQLVLLRSDAEKDQADTSDSVYGARDTAPDIIESAVQLFVDTNSDSVSRRLVWEQQKYG